MQPALRLVIDFTDPAEVARWRSIDDVVMGGRSSSRLVTDDDGSALFTGRVSFEDGGGFASVRTTGARCALEGARSVRLRVRGDGKTYRLRCIAATPSGEIGYQARFPTTADAWTDVELDLARFEPRRRGRLLGDAPPLDPGAVRGLGLSIADGQEGAFRLQIASLSLVRQRPDRRPSSR